LSGNADIRVGLQVTKEHQPINRISAAGSAWKYQQMAVITFYKRAAAQGTARSPCLQGTDPGSRPPCCHTPTTRRKDNADESKGK